MTRSFGPAVYTDPATKALMRATCGMCMFRNWRGGDHACTYPENMALRDMPYRPIENTSDTPDWCKMKAGAIRDATDMAKGFEHYVVRWSGRKTDVPREIYAGIPSEADRQFRLASRDAKRGTVQLQTLAGKVLRQWPEANS